MNNNLPTMLKGLVGGCAGRKLGAMQVATQFPEFNKTHGHAHEIFAMLAGSILFGIGGYYIHNKRQSEIQDTMQS